MSRIEKNLEKKYKLRRLGLISKILFILCMTINLFVSIYVVDSSAKNLLGEKTDYNQVSIKSIEATINKNLESINEYIINIIGQFNKE